ncbi:substrate-binding domain-containing protein [Rhodobacter sphaeroides]|jgi:ribose transport system substrate-binding protein|uniref:Monosaccharide ABC transporter substrate-binding protein, CUT2 family n=1 Tax=Cereibacter sphaeroides (strain ATCC 17023 / DSM 158 / JCM 6121 / CCUG 31486 / LMG 2827 / NBRC 12203 / NCIMB 8253 / ATH 2.4.1.) TaxID=272943 RepID=Q3J3W0_CERS4|nr:sugar ABC transporter substrate-binding protein [Cereibacter sphaeroides]ABA78524.1 monosaccharide ABC transporter substrate-binding protein, CUT2 family [Cereibacter sphaeroides 2.4.1]AMJ46875.1 sugar ABC transporter substrate-binding protein [Cereibacter sphaeroides]ANS33587.1 sugar ABC transporter substrate-binding protein [Cereibacter sphaeroides]ATN62631.1 sugar ABC transporter substrate-binding protein [Cereibacter sphaeroides]AXC60744.1 sugar ABC transporter substrate-binding protein
MTTKTAKGLTIALLLLATLSPALAEELTLEGKTIGITAIGTDHDWDLKAYQAQIAEIERLGGTAIALDAGRNDQTQVSQIQTLIAQKPDAIIEQLGNLDVLNPWLQKINDAGIPLFTVDTATPHAINNTTSNNYSIGAELALQMVADLGGKGNVLVFNGFYSVPVCKIRYDQMKYVLEAFPDVKIIEPELRDVIPNTIQSAYSNVTDMLTKYPNEGDVGAIWACWDVPMIGATQALQAAGRTDIRTYGVDGSPEFVEMVADPESPAGAVAAQQPSEIGKLAVQNVARHLAGQEVKPFTFAPAVLITKENAAETAADFLPK